MIEELRKDKHSVVGLIQTLDGIIIVVNNKPYAKTNGQMDYMLLNSFKKDEKVMVNSLFIDAIEANRYLIIEQGKGYMKCVIKEIHQFVDLDKKETEISSTYFTKVNITKKT